MRSIAEFFVGGPRAVDPGGTNRAAGCNWPRQCLKCDGRGRRRWRERFMCSLWAELVPGRVARMPQGGQARPPLPPPSNFWNNIQNKKYFLPSSPSSLQVSWTANSLPNQFLYMNSLNSSQYDICSMFWKHRRYRTESYIRLLPLVGPGFLWIWQIDFLVWSKVKELSTLFQNQSFKFCQCFSFHTIEIHWLSY